MKRKNCFFAVKKRNQQKGFFLVEIVIGIAVIGMLAMFFLPGLIQNKEDAKYSTALNQLEKDFPSAIIRQVGRTQSCTTANITKELLQQRGLPATTVWNSAWSVASVGSNLVTINYTIESNDDNAASDLAAALGKSNNISSATATGNTQVSVAYRCN